MVLILPATSKGMPNCIAYQHEFLESDCGLSLAKFVLCHEIISTRCAGYGYPADAELTLISHSGFELRSHLPDRALASGSRTLFPLGLIAPSVRLSIMGKLSVQGIIVSLLTYKNIGECLLRGTLQIARLLRNVRPFLFFSAQGIEAGNLQCRSVFVNVMSARILPFISHEFLFIPR